MAADPLGALTGAVAETLAAAHGFADARVRLEARFGRPVPAALVDERWSADRIAYWLYANEPAPDDCLLRPLDEHPELPPLFYVHSAAGNALVARALERRLPGPVVGIRAAGLAGEREVPRTVAEFAEVYVPQVLRYQPNGPCAFAGFSAGGCLAVELAARVRALGVPVGPVILLDSEHPTRSADRPLATEADLVRRRVDELARLTGVDGGTPEVAASALVYARVARACRQYVPPLLPGPLHVVTAEIGAAGAADWRRSAADVRAHVLRRRHDEYEFLADPATLSVLRTVMADEGGWA